LPETPRAKYVARHRRELRSPQWPVAVTSPGGTGKALAQAGSVTKETVDGGSAAEVKAAATAG
jgi:hypothetical protein